MAKSSTSFSKDKQPSRGRGKAQRTKLLEAMERMSKTEEDFYDLLMQRAFNPEDQFGLGEVLKRLHPIPKQVAPVIEFDLDPKAKPHVKAQQTLDAISSGIIPPDIGSMIIQSIKSFVDIEEYTDLKERIEKLEAIINGDVVSEKA